MARAARVGAEPRPGAAPSPVGRGRRWRTTGEGAPPARRSRLVVAEGVSGDGWGVSPGGLGAQDGDCQGPISSPGVLLRSVRARRRVVDRPGVILEHTLPVFGSGIPSAGPRHCGPATSGREHNTARSGLSRAPPEGLLGAARTSDTSQAHPALVVPLPLDGEALQGFRLVEAGVEVIGPGRGVRRSAIWCWSATASPGRQRLVGLRRHRGAVLLPPQRSVEGGDMVKDGEIPPGSRGAPSRASGSRSPRAEAGGGEAVSRRAIESPKRGDGVEEDVVAASVPMGAVELGGLWFPGLGRSRTRLAPGLRLRKRRSCFPPGASERR